MKQIKISQTPCIGVCSTIYGDDICRGCMRTYKEVIDWNSYTDKEKLEILLRLEQQIISEVAPLLKVNDHQLLLSKLQLHAIKHYTHQSELCHAYALLKVRAEEIENIADYGIEILPGFTAKTLLQLITDVDDRIYSKAEMNFS